MTIPSSSSSSSSVSVSGNDAEEDEDSAKPRVEYASEDWEDEELSFSPHSSEFFDARWLRDKGTKES